MFELLNLLNVPLAHTLRNGRRERVISISFPAAAAAFLGTPRA